MSEKMTWDPHCYECKVRYRDPKAKDLVMYLHAWRYKVRITDLIKDHQGVIYLFFLNCHSLDAQKSQEKAGQNKYWFLEADGQVLKCADV